MDETRNIVLIGMPAVGKSTVGVLLAKASRRAFLDTDVFLQATRGRALQEIIDSEGPDAFCLLEQRCVMAMDVRGHVIATGGSVIYSDAAMQHLADSGKIVHLDLPIEQIERRLSNLTTRGLVIAPGRTLRDLYRQREALYRRWAGLTIDCAGKNQDQIVTEILDRLGRREKR